MASVDATVAKRVLREVHEMQQSPAEGVRVLINEHNITEVQAEIDGPVGTPYEGGVFRLRLQLAGDYPASPPKGFFITRLFHPNVSATGEICVNVLKKDWSPDMGLRHVLMVIKCLLVHTNPESALNEEAGRLLQEDYEEFASRARLMTSIHAQKRPGPLQTASIANTQQQQPQHQQGGLHGTDGDKGQATASPAAKKAKPDHGVPSATGSSAAGKLPTAAGAGGTKATTVKKSLKRL